MSAEDYGLDDNLMCECGHVLADHDTDGNLDWPCTVKPSCDCEEFTEKV